ncbi:MAG: NlpC/P60 family protein [Treponema sp.]|nr:NlpC/P60 family protein [Treponema sp.]
MKKIAAFLLALLCAAAADAAPLAAPLAGRFHGATAGAAEIDAAHRAARERILAFALIHEGAPYLSGGATEAGMDCSGFVYLSFSEALGVSVPRTSESLFLWAQRIAPEQRQPGDLVFFSGGSAGRIDHVGIYIGAGRFVHSASQGRRTGVILSALDEPYWAGIYAGSGRALPPSRHFGE